MQEPLASEATAPAPSDHPQPNPVATPSLDRHNLPRVIAIEGNIGAGKSTVMAHLKARFANREDVVFIDEPVDEWRAHGFLKRMYEDADVKPAFQHMVLMSLAGDLLKALAAEPKPKYIITERSPWGNYHVFGKANLEGDDFKMYEFTWKRVMGGLPAQLQKRFLWLKVGYTVGDMELLQERMKKRKRDEEVAGVDDSYLATLECAHAEWLEPLDPDLWVSVNALGLPCVVTERVDRVLDGWMDQSVTRVVGR